MITCVQDAEYISPSQLPTCLIGLSELITSFQCSYHINNSDYDRNVGNQVKSLIQHQGL